jgi:hypothetical protein
MGYMKSVRSRPLKGNGRVGVTGVLDITQFRLQVGGRRYMFCWDPKKELISATGLVNSCQTLYFVVILEFWTTDEVQNASGAVCYTAVRALLSE